jgi:hypothetical protein
MLTFLGYSERFLDHKDGRKIDRQLADNFRLGNSGNWPNQPSQSQSDIFQPHSQSTRTLRFCFGTLQMDTTLQMS